MATTSAVLFGAITFVSDLSLFLLSAYLVRSFQMPRVIIYESVQLVLFVIADTRRSRANITLTTNSAAMTVLRALVMGGGEIYNLWINKNAHN